MQKIKELTLRITVTDHEKFAPIYKKMFIQTKLADMEYGFHATASAHGDLFSERNIYERALEKVEQNDLLKEDLFTGKEIKSDDEDFDPYYEDVRDLAEDAFKQGEHHRDSRNLEYGTQRELMLAFKGDTNGSSVSAGSGEGKENQCS